MRSNEYYSRPVSRGVGSCGCAVAQAVPSIQLVIPHQYTNLVRRPQRRAHHQPQQGVREPPVQMELGTLAARRELRQRTRESREGPPVENGIDERHGQYE